MGTPCLPVLLCAWITTLAAVLDARQRARFVQLCTGLLFARGRRTVTSWLRGCGVGRDFKRYYYLLGSVGRKTLPIAAALLRIVLRKVPGDAPGAPLVFAIDDSPTKRYGPQVEGAGKHHNPTPGPAGAPFRIACRMWRGSRSLSALTWQGVLWTGRFEWNDLR